MAPVLEIGGDSVGKMISSGSSGTVPKHGGEDLRCICNKLLCVIKGNAIEIKCNKCKRLVTIYTQGVKDIRFS